MTTKEYKGCPLMDIPISTARTRSKLVDFESETYVNNTVETYKSYIRELKKNIQQRFIINSTSYKVGKSLESLLDFSWLMHPTTEIQYCELSDISVNSFKELFTPLHFVSTQNEQDLKQLLFEYTELCKYAAKSANDLRGNCSFSMFNQNVFKQFVAINKEKCSLLFKFLCHQKQ